MTKFTERFSSFACDGESISCTVDGFDVVARIVHDDDTTPPWDREDGHGLVSDWTRRAKEPGERILSGDHPYHRYYDVERATRIAKRDGWDTPPFGEGTAKEQATRAVDADYNALRLWCADEWWYVGIVLSVHRDGVELGGASLWGVDCNHPAGDNSYLSEVADELLPEAIEDARATLERLCCVANREYLDGLEE